MEDDESLMDVSLRRTALSLTVDLHKVWLREGCITATVEHQLDDIRYIANRFFEYLKGETK